MSVKHMLTLRAVLASLRYASLDACSTSSSASLATRRSSTRPHVASDTLPRYPIPTVLIPPPYFPDSASRIRFLFVSYPLSRLSTCLPFFVARCVLYHVCRSLKDRRSALEYRDLFDSAPPVEIEIRAVMILCIPSFGYRDCLYLWNTYIPECEFSHFKDACA